jgi:hypothetical protein
MPNNYFDIKSDTTLNIQNRDALANSILKDTEALKETEQLIRQAIAEGNPTSGLETERDNLNISIDNNKATLAGTQLNLDSLLNDYETYIDHTTVVNNLNDQTPILLLPVRIETRFHKYMLGLQEKYQIWIRIFPDDIAIESHEAALTKSEIAQSQIYWTTVWTTSNSTVKVNAWDVVCRQFTSQRAAWIIKQMEPLNVSQTPRPPAPDFPDDTVLEKRYTTWTKAPETRVMPDVFVAHVYQNYDPNNPIPLKIKQGRPVPSSLKVGIDPNDENSLKRSGTNGEDISASNDINWLLDFDAAIQNGMGMKVDLDNLSQYNSTFQRITVVGVKALSDQNHGKVLLESLFDNHHFNRGLSLLKQATRTKNSADDPSGYSYYEFGNSETYVTELGPEKVTPNVTMVEKNKRDGQRLSEALGVSYQLFDHIYHADGYDIRDAMNMNTVLFSATVGYSMDTIFSPVFDFTTVSVYDPIEETRQLMNAFIRARGAVSSIRVGKQPYGILPLCSVNRMQMPAPHPKKIFYDDVNGVTATMSTTWNNAVPNIKVAGNPNQEAAFSESMGKQAVSQEFYARYGAGPAYVWNNLVFNDMAGAANMWMNNQQNFAANASAQSGFNFSQLPFILQMNLKDDHNRIVSGLVDSKPVSEKHTTESLPGTDTNYISWLSQSSLAYIRDENFTNVGGSIGADPPESLLYLFMRQSMLLEYFNAACKVLGYTAAQKREYEIINIPNVIVPPPPEGGGPQIPPEALYQSGQSRWAIFDVPYGPGGDTVGTYLDQPGAQGTPPLANIQAMRLSLAELSGLSTADLALLLGEHLDLASYRLDSWKLGIMNERLNSLRLDANGVRISDGIFLGAYGWLENLTAKVRTTVDTTGMGLPASFETPIENITNNKGYIHAPSQNQAIAAAMLRAGYDSNATISNPTSHEINLTSERVRIALNIFEGVKNGQQMGTLLGYEFERALHERHDLDLYIHPFRTKYKMNILTADYEGAAETVSAINVLDGKKILDDYKNDPDSVFTGLSFSQSYTPPQGEKDEIKSELYRLEGILDAIGDVAVAEGAFQVVNNNYEAADALTSALSGGKNAPDPQIVKTPRTGISLTNRVIKLLETKSYTINGGNPPGSNSWSGIGKSHRAMAEPSLNEWLKNQLPDPSLIELYVTYANAAPPPANTIKRVYLSQLDIQPIDLIYIIPDTLSNDESELAQRVKKYIRETFSLVIDKEIAIDYMASADTGKTRLYDMHSYLVQLKKLVLDGRYVKSTDFCQGGSEEAAMPDRYHYDDLWNRIDRALNGVPLVVPLYGLKGISTRIGTLIADITPNPAPTLSELNELSDLMQAAAHFGIERTITKTRSSLYSDLLNAAASVKEQADKKVDAVMLILVPPAPLPPLPDSSSGQEDKDIPGFVQKLMKCAKILFGDSFRIIPQIMVQDKSANALNAHFKTNPLVIQVNTLLTDHYDNPLVVDGWLNSVSRVRKKIATLEMVSVLADVVNNRDSFNSIEFRPFQFPYDNDSFDRWMALGITALTEEERMKKLKSNRLCLAISEDVSTFFATYITGFVIDDWTEVIPNSEEVSGIAFHYDQPESKPPQVLLLAMSPVFTGQWAWDDLLATVNETLDEAKSRAVSYEEVSTSPFGQFLPGTWVPATDGAMTIGPSLSYLSRLFM